MKIDTSKLTPVQAQQIEAIASGVPFNLHNHAGKPFLRSPISINMTSAQDPEYYDRLIEHHAGTLNGLIAKNDTENIESQRQHISRLESRRAGNPSWDCLYEIRSERFYDLPIHWRRDNGGSLLAKINAHLADKHGLENLSVTAWALYPAVSVETTTWQEAHQWYQDHLDLDNDVLAAEVDAIVDEYLATLSTLERLSLKRGEVADSLIIPKYHALRPFRSLKATLSKALDFLRPKA